MKIIGTGSALPKKIVTNMDLEKMMDTSDEWIRSRTGIGTRHLAVEETTTSMSVEAAKQAMEAAGITAEELDLIVAATVTADRLIPTLSCEVQSELGAKNAVAFDLSAGCSGFLFALATVHAQFLTGYYKKALVIGAETLSKIMDWEDRSTCVLFGDGAGAVVVSAEEDSLLSVRLGSDGASGMVLNCPGRLKKNPFVEQKLEETNFVHMEGQAVYKFAVRTVPKAVNQVLEEAGIAVDDVSLFLLHQANLRIIEAVAKRLKQPLEKFPTNMEQNGNVSAASIPILLDEVCRKGLIKKGDIIVMSGFGAGLTWGACVFRW